MEYEIYDTNLSLNDTIMVTPLDHLLLHQAEILDDFNRYKFLRPMKRKMAIILNRLHNRNNKSAEKNELDKKTLSKANSDNLIGEILAQSLITTDNVILQNKCASFKGKK